MLYNVIWERGGQKYDSFALYNIWMAPWQMILYIQKNRQIIIMAKTNNETID